MKLMAAVKKPKFSRDLVVRSVAGEPRAREELASACLPHVWHTVYLATGGGPEVDDIAQNAIIDAFVGLPTYRGTGDFSAWLNRITVRAVYRHMRRRALKSLLPSSDWLEQVPDRSSASTPDRETETRRLLDRVAAHMKGIALKNRMALILSLVHGYTVSEIASALGCSIEAAKKRLQRGRLALDKRLERDPLCQEMIQEAGR
jgi:RNA polymerase sigma-70 factor (ECF subfamily)